MQAFSSTGPWTAPTGTLGELTRAAFDRAQAAEARLPDLRARAADQPRARSLKAALRGPSVRVIAEVKRSSPSKGAIAPHLDAAEQAARYVAGGAAAISVLTEPSRFGGSLADLADVAARVEAPVIRKDFLVSPVQLWEARAAGASAVLLIVRALEPPRFRDLLGHARDIGLDVLVEVRDEEELATALSADASIIGVNNRNLETLVIDPMTAMRLIPAVPPALIAVAESGMRETADVEAVARAGADAVLVGSAVSAATDPQTAVRALAAVTRQSR